MRGVRYLRENGGDTVSLVKRTVDRIIIHNGSYDAAHPTETIALSSIVSSHDIGWSPVVLCSMSNRLRFIVGCERIDPNIKLTSL